MTSPVIEAVLGIIPARAGSTSTFSRSATEGWDHPRAGGEHDLYTDEDGPAWGSSPRGRGAPVSERLERGAHGIIPARAGSTAVFMKAASDGRDHPRAGGEHKSPNVTKGHRMGSSPRGRGALCQQDLHGNRLGIIPARAGSTLR